MRIPFLTYYKRWDMKRIGITLVSLIVMAVLVFCLGCGGEKEKNAVPAVEKAKPVKAPAKSEGGKAVKKAVQEASAIDLSKSKEVLDKVGITYSYDPVNKPDPFKPFKADDRIEGMSTDNPLLKYEVRYFRLVGLSVDDTEPIALFEDPNGRAFILHVGDRIGRSGGVVQSITRDKVIITETKISPRFEAGTETVQIPIRLHPEDFVER